VLNPSDNRSVTRTGRSVARTTALASAGATDFSGIAIRDDGLGTGVATIQVLENRVSGAEASGLDVTSAVRHVVEAFENDFTNSQVDGISMGSATRGNLLRQNEAIGNDGFDCRDESTGGRTAGTANRWRNNSGGTDSPDGICP
jgi:hypothetical protein